MNASNKSVKVINAAVARDLKTSITAEDIVTSTREGKGLLASSHRCGDGGDTGLDVDGDGCVPSGGDDDGGGLVDHGDYEDGVLVEIGTVGFRHRVGAGGVLGAGAVVVDEFFGL